RGLLLAIPALVAFGGIKFCAKKAPKLADNAFHGGSHIIADAAEGARKGLRRSDESLESGSLRAHAIDTTVEEGLQVGADAALDDDESDAEQEGDG
ncbi:MAG: hypothetical protein AAGG01_10155, partial [Planctomycetota bacterium]